MGLEKYESKLQQVQRSAEQIYAAISRFDNFTPILQDKVEEWEAEEDRCSFKAKGFNIGLRMVEREQPTHIKVQGDGVPMDFTFWVQLKEVAPYDTRMRLVLHTELNFMMKMMVGSKLQEGLDQMAEQIASGLNSSL